VCARPAPVVKSPSQNPQVAQRQTPKSPAHPQVHPQDSHWVASEFVVRAFDSGRLFGVVHGGQPPRVLALHGWRRTSADFDRALAGLDALALDLPGFGASPPPPEAWGAADYAKAVSAVLADMDTPVVVLGHSFGGRVAVHLAADRPEAVRALVLTGVPLIRRAPTGAHPPFAFRAARWLNRRGLLPDARMEALRRKHGSDDYRAATGVMRDVLVRSVNESYEAELGRVQCPVELVWGDDDTAAPFSIAQQAASILGDHAAVTVLPGAGHLTPLSAPDQLRAALERYL
jgi:pimeloyl-ACP methyl ester carboxylesterase